MREKGGKEKEMEMEGMEKWKKKQETSKSPRIYQSVGENRETALR